MKFAYCGYDFFHPCLSELLSEGHELVELFTWPTDNEYDFNNNVLGIAQSKGVRITMSPLKEDDLERLRALAVDIIICAAYPYKIPKWEGYVRYAINIHPSPLPIGRGPWPLPRIIYDNLTQSAVSIHAVSERWDAGDIIAQEAFDLSERETLESLSMRSQLIAKRMISGVVKNIDELWRSKVPQGVGTYWPMPSRENRTITWDMSVQQIDRIVRAFSKFEPFVFLDGIRHFVRKVDFWEEVHNLTPGTVAHRANREVVYAAKDGFVCLTNYVRADENAG